MNHFGNCTFEGMQLNGKKTLRENIAGVMSIKTIYKAYSEVSNDDKPIPKLQNYTNKQLFWISVGQYSCSKFTTKGAIKQMETDSHSIEKCRINMLVSNYEEFAKDFCCPAGAKMNSTKKCTFW
ncbi:ECE2 (predicted) [Pycnogonum litorale]